MTIQKLALLTAALFSSAVAANGAEFLVYAGSGASGIYGYRFNSGSGKLKSLGLMANLPKVTFLIEHPDHRFLYTVSDDGIGAFLLDPKSGKLNLVNSVKPKGEAPCYLALDRGGRWLAVAYCGDGAVSMLPLRKDGGIGEQQSLVRPDGAASARALVFSPDNRFLLVSDFGLGRIYSYGFRDDSGALTPAETPFLATEAGAGVGRLAFHPDGAAVYVLNPLRAAVVFYRYDRAHGSLGESQTVATLPPAAPRAGHPLHLAFNASGSMLYVSNDGLNSMALMVVDPVRLTLSVLEYTPLVGNGPRHFAMDPTGVYLLVASQESNAIDVYTVHPRSGQLRPVRGSVKIEKPECLTIVPAK